jgi:hypothetical protein
VLSQVLSGLNVTWIPIEPGGGTAWEELAREDDRGSCAEEEQEKVSWAAETADKGAIPIREFIRFILFLIRLIFVFLD